MNGPQRAACLAKGYANNQWTDFLESVIGPFWALFILGHLTADIPVKMKQ